MRTTPEECREIGALIARKLNAATGPTELFVPLRGVSAIATEGSRSTIPKPTRRSSTTLREQLDPTTVEVHEIDADVNDPAFALRWRTGCTS